MTAENTSANDSLPEETRALARLPGVDIAIVHTAAHGGRGESVAVMLQQTPMPALLALDPMRLWMQMAQAAWAPWLALTGALWALPHIMGQK